MLNKKILLFFIIIFINSCSQIEYPEQISNEGKRFSKMAYNISKVIEKIPQLNKEKIYFSIVNINLDLKNYLVDESFILKTYIEEDTKFEIFERKNIVKDRKLLIVANGGSFINAYRNFRRDFFIKEIGKKLEDFDVIIVDYRVGFQHRFPVQSVDFLNAYRASLKLGYLPNNIVFIGDSAGGNIVFSSTLYLSKNNLPMPNSVIAMSPYLDATNTVASRETNRKLDVVFGSPSNRVQDINELPYFIYLKNQKYEYASPIYAKNIKKFPKTLIQVGDYEILEDDSVEMYNLLKKYKIDATLEEYPGMTHVFQFSNFEESRIAINNIIKFIESNIGNGKKETISKKTLDKIRFNVKFDEIQEEKVLDYYFSKGINLKFKREVERQKYQQFGRENLNILLDYSKYKIK